MRRPLVGALGLDGRALAWVLTGLAVVVFLVLRDSVSWIATFPSELTLSVSQWLNEAMAWTVTMFKPAFRALSWTVEQPMNGVQWFLQWLPWPVFIIACAFLSYVLGGWRLALFTVASLVYVLLVGFWTETMNTLAMVAVAVPVSLTVGLFIGIAGHRWHRARRTIEPTLDLMQTIPAFAYLIPIVLLFGLGPVVGVVACAIYAIPPMVRNVMLGLERVAPEIVDSGVVCGATQHQLLWWVKVPSALPTVMVGVNQTIMATLSVAVLASVLGGYPDIGWVVLATMKKAQFGQSLLAGAVIALIAMVMDRMSRGYVERVRAMMPHDRPWYRERPVWFVLSVIVAIAILSAFIPVLHEFPATWRIDPARALNDAVKWFAANFFDVTETIKTWALYFLLLPLKAGMEHAVNPRFWGFELTGGVIATYTLIVALVAYAALRYVGWRAGAGVIAAGVVYYFGTLGIPWPVFMLVLAVLAYQVGGGRTFVMTVAMLVFIAVTGFWKEAMVTLQLTGAAVILSFVIGTSLGIWAASNDRVSAFLRPINDTLQTMPLFVFLIPALMVFLIGEFTALLSIIAYAVVPAIRYTEHGIRNVSFDVVEAAEAFGCTRGQVLRYVQLPLALPEIMLGLNQTIMMALAMVVVATLVGATGLGQGVMKGVSANDFGLGAVTGLSIAFIAMISDRILQSWSLNKKAELGLA